MTTTCLLIARHGNNFTPGEIVRRIGARTDLPLSPEGREQAARFGRYLRAQGLLPDRVFASELRRTQETARLALDAAGRVVPVEIRPFLNEIDYGPDENMPEDQVTARLGQQALKDWEEHAVVPNGWRADPNRQQQAWLDFGMEVLRSCAGRIILAVTSNGVARFAPCLAGPLETFRASWPAKLATGALGILTHDGAAWQVNDWNRRP